MPRVFHAAGSLLLLLGVAWMPVQAQTFSQEVAPILSQKCMQCHGQAPLMGSLDLRSRETALKGGQHGPAFVPGDASASSMYRHLTGQEKPQMPLGGRLNEREIGVIKDWINSGAAWETSLTLGAENPFSERQRRHWAFQKLVKPAAPVAGHPVDAFLLAKMKEKKVRPNPPADKITLLRRASLDLIGLPPSPEEVQAFLADPSPDAFAKVVDRLLASPQYGERWGRHWLDLARYADTEGFKSDETRPHIWRYRDYVIQSFNEDKPYDRFIREQIAGDELYPDDPSARIAVGFNRHFTDESNAPVIDERRQDILNNITDTVGAVFLGLTVGCARCHDHKFDPILQKDYYRLQAFFANLRAEDQMALLSGEKLEAYQGQYAAWDAQTRDLRREMHDLVEPIGAAKRDYYKNRFSEATQIALATPIEKHTPLQSLLYLKAMPQITYPDRSLIRELKAEQRKRFAELEAALQQHDSLRPPEPPVAQTVRDNGREAPKTFLLAGGVWNAPREEVQPGFLSILDPTDAKLAPAPEGLSSTGRRTVLANWLADARNPLTARVMANRIWHYHFGRGIAASPSDFGAMGDRPTNPPLLDYLAAAFVENGWSIKKMHRLIMLSRAYRESSSAQEAAAALDPDNTLYWRYPRHRAEGEVIRDAMLLASGKLNLKMGGPGVYPELPAGAVPTRYNEWKVNKDPEELNRRSVYIFVKRNMVYPMLEAFDQASSQETCPRRFQTVIPSQALTLLNDPLVRQWSRALAGRVLNDTGLSTEQQVERAFGLVVSRPPHADERQAVLAFLNQQSTEIGDRAAAFVDFCHALLNSNEFLYVN